jgi:hypothetical protein
MSTVTTAGPSLGAARPDRAVRALCLATAALTLPVFALTDLGTGDTGEAITGVLEEDRAALTAGGLLAVLVAAGLLLAAVRVGRSVGGDAGRMITASGAGVALLYAAYYGVFGAGAVVAGEMLADPGPGLGEASALLLNMTEIARFAPGLALLGAAAAARRALARPAWATGVALLLLMFVPFTTWVAALLTPLWLAVVASTVAPAGAQADAH